MKQKLVPRTQPLDGATKKVTQDGENVNPETQQPQLLGSLAAAIMNPEEQAKIRLKRRVEDSLVDQGSSEGDEDEALEFLRWKK